MNLLQQLSEPFSDKVERTISKGGTRLTYIPVSEVITRMNKVIGVDKWSSQVIRVERDSLDPDFIVAHVRVTAELEGRNIVTKDGFGGQKIKRTKSGDIVDLGDEYKGAVSDAFKKACQMLGVGLYLARSEEALEADIEEPDSQLRTLWNNFVSVSKGLTKEQKSALGDFWTTYSGGRPKPTLETATEEDLSALMEQCIMLTFDAVEVVDE
jgi:hypothetical protein